MKLLHLDIENHPGTAHIWSLWPDQVYLPQLRDPVGMFSFAAKWHNEKRVKFYSDFHDGHGTMIDAAYDLINNADVVCHFNGTRFDMRHLRREFLLAGLDPHKPVREIDLHLVVKKKFHFMSTKLRILGRRRRWRFCRGALRPGKR